VSGAAFPDRVVYDLVRMSLAHRQASPGRKGAGAKRRAKTNAQVANSCRSNRDLDQLGSACAEVATQDNELKSLQYKRLAKIHIEKLAIALAKGSLPESLRCAKKALHYAQELNMAYETEQTAQDNRGMTARTCQRCSRRCWQTVWVC
jgi:hypothetical protein